VSLYVVTDADGSLTAYLRQLIETIPPPQKRHGEKDDRSISLINISFSKWAECTQVMLNNLNKNIIVPSFAWVRTHTFLQKIQNSMSMNSMNSITYEPLYFRILDLAIKLLEADTRIEIQKSKSTSLCLTYLYSSIFHPITPGLMQHPEKSLY